MGDYVNTLKISHRIKKSDPIRFGENLTGFSFLHCEHSKLKSDPIRSDLVAMWTQPKIYVLLIWSIGQFINYKTISEVQDWIGRDRSQLVDAIGTNIQDNKIIKKLVWGFVVFDLFEILFTII